MGYYVDLSKITIENFQKKLECSYLPPSRTILKNQLNERFGYFKKIGIKNIQELMQLLKKKAAFDELSTVACFSGDYLTILLRELKSTLPKPTKIADFNQISKQTIDKLANAGIANTEKLYDRVLTKNDRQKLVETTGIEYSEILELTKLTDLSRMKWVGATYARLLYDIGMDTVVKVSNADPVELHAKILVDVAKDLPLEIEY